MSSTVLSIVLPVMILIAAGWIAARCRYVSEKVGDGLSEYVFSIAVPALIISTLTKPSAFSGIVLGYWMAYFGGVAAVWTIGMFAAFRWFRRGHGEAVMFGFSAGQSNIVLLGVPLILGAYGDEAAPAMFLLFAVHLPIMMTAAALMMDAQHGLSGAQFARLGRTLLRNPIIQALIVGLALRAIGITPDGVAKTFLDAIGGTASTCALIAMGMSLSRYSIARHWQPSLILVALKLVLHPLVVWVLAFEVFGLPPVLGGVATLFAALPTGINAYLLAARYKAGEEAVSSTIVLSTVLSVVSISVWLGLLLHR